MLKAKRMKKVFLAGPKSMMKEVIEELYGLGVIHISEYKKEQDEDVFDIGNPLPEAEKYSEVLVKIRSMKSLLGAKGTANKNRQISLDEISSQVNKLHSEIGSIQKRMRYFEKVSEIINKGNVPAALENLEIEAGETSDLGTVYFIGFIRNDISDALDGITKKYRLYDGTYEDVKLTGLFIDKRKKDAAQKLLNESDFIEIDSPYIKARFGALNSLPANKFTKLDNELKRIEKEKSLLEAKRRQIGNDNAEFLLYAEEKISSEVEIAEVPLRFATSENTFFIRGWVPKESQEKLEKNLSKITNNRIYVSFEEPGKHDAVPIALDNPKPVNSFEVLMDMYTLPSYREIDPTFFMFLTFPIFFGFMLGDMGYGLVTLLLFLFLKTKMPGAKDLLNAMIIASISTIFFGALFGEFFGLEEIGETHLPHLISRAHSINELLIISILMGVVHINIGLIIGFINELNHHGLKKAIFAKLSWIVLQISVALIYLSLTGGLALHVGVGAALAVASVIMIYLGEGIKGLIELPGLMSNILSYGRLMAVGLASVMLALVVNDLAGQMFASGIVGIIAGIIVLIFGHTINIALGILSPFLHSLRLHYVEFFAKFYEGGGYKFKAFGNNHRR